MARFIVSSRMVVEASSQAEAEANGLERMRGEKSAGILDYAIGKTRYVPKRGDLAEVIHPKDEWTSRRYKLNNYPPAGKPMFVMKANGHDERITGLSYTRTGKRAIAVWTRDLTASVKGATA